MGTFNKNIKRKRGIGGNYRKKNIRSLAPKSSLGKDSWRRCYLSSILKDELELGGMKKNDEKGIAG